MDEASGKFVAQNSSMRKLLLTRRILVPWLLSAVVMCGISYLWHGIALTDLREIKIPVWLYLVISGLVYLGIGLVITVAMHLCIRSDLISIKRGFPLKGAVLGSLLGFAVYMVAFLFGMSFTSHKLAHILADVLWQMLEQGIGGVLVSFGIIYDLHQSFLEAERAN
jgi:hypothetical protein